MAVEQPEDEGTLTVRYFAAAAAAAGLDSETRPAGTVADVLAGACADHPGLDRVASACTVLVDGLAAAPADAAPAGATLDLLPPFAGG